MIKSNVLVVADKATGEISRNRIINYKDPETGKALTREVGVVMVQSKSLSGLSSLARVSTRTAFITLEQDALEFLMESGQLKDGKEFPVEGRIVIEETLEPYIKKDGTTQNPKIKPTTGEIMTYKGQPVYRNSFFSEDISQSDVYLRESANALAPVMAEEDEFDAPE
jgi:hypothetical protein